MDTWRPGGPCGEGSLTTPASPWTPSLLVGLAEDDMLVDVRCTFPSDTILSWMWTMTRPHRIGGRGMGDQQRPESTALARSRPAVARG